MLCYISDVEKAQLDVEDSDDSRSLIAVAVCVPGFVVAAVVVIWKKCRKSIKVCDCCCTSLLCGSFISKTVTEITFVLDLFCHTIQDFSLAFLILLFGIFCHSLRCDYYISVLFGSATNKITERQGLCVVTTEKITQSLFCQFLATAVCMIIG